jgi:hypothetical protein
MAKGNKVADGPVEPVKQSVLQAAWDKFEAGDMLEARRLALAVEHGTVGRDDGAVAVELAKLMTGSRVVGTTPGEVAKEIVERTKPDPKSYVWAAVTLSILALLVTLAITRYAHP